MSKILIMAEGAMERALIARLLDENMLCFTRSDLLYGEISSERQISLATVAKINAIPFSEKIDLYRVGDKFTDEVKVPKEIRKERIGSIVKVLTKPEIEILLIIREGLFDGFMKRKSDTKACSYYKSHNPEYSKSAKFANEYLGDLSRKEIVEMLRDYDSKRKGVHAKDEFSIASLLKPGL